MKEGDKPGCIAVVKNIGSVKDEGENVSWNRKASLKTRYVIIDNNPEGSSLGFLSCYQSQKFAQIPEFRIGSIREQPFSKLWNDPENPVLKMFREKKEFLTGKRRSCSYLDLCGGGCQVRAYWQSGEFYADDPFCFIEKWTPHSPFSRRM